MLIYKITLTVFGDKFFPNEILSKLSEDLNMVGYHSPTDKNDYDKNDYGFGAIFFMHPKIFSVLGEGTEYEEDFIEFFEKHHSLFIAFGADEFDFFTEIYYSGEQCNFEIFDRTLLSRINKLQNNIALPVSVYHLKEKQIKELLIIK